MNWLDIAIHIGLAVVGICLLSLLGAPLWIVLGINTVFWPARELWQKRTAPRDFFSVHVTLEWLPAVVAGGVIYAVMR